MAALTASVSGSISNSATFGGTSFTNGDDVTVATGVTFDIDTGTPTFGAAGVAGTNALTVQGTGIVNITVPTVARGDVTQQRGSTINISTVGGNTGSLTFFPPAAVVYKWVCNTTGSGSPTIRLTGDSISDRVLIDTNLSSNASGHFYFDFTQGANTWAPILDWQFFKIDKCGGTGTTTSTQSISYEAAPSANGSLRWRYGRFTTIGRVFINVADSDAQIDIQNCDWRSGRNGEWIRLQGSSARTGVGIRRFLGCTWYDSTFRTVVNWGRDWTFGQTEGCAFNTKIEQDIADLNTAISQMWFLHVVANSSGLIAGRANNGMVVEECILGADTVDNPHYVSNSADDAGGNIPIMRYCIFDGFGFVGSDAGDCYLASGSPVKLYNILAINRAGSVISVLNTAARLYVWRMTVHGVGCFINANENGFGGADNWIRMTSCLFISQPTGFTWDSWSAQTQFACDYNGFYDQTQATNIDHPVLAQNSYLKAATTWAASGSAYGDNYRGQHDVYGDPQFVDNTRTLVSWYNSIAGSGGSMTAVRDAVIKINGTAADGSDATYDSAYSLSAAKAYLREGFRPQNRIYKHTGDPAEQASAGDIGAVDLDTTVTDVRLARKVIRPRPYAPGLAR